MTTAPDALLLTCGMLASTWGVGVPHILHQSLVAKIKAQKACSFVGRAMPHIPPTSGRARCQVLLQYDTAVQAPRPNAIAR